MVHIWFPSSHVWFLSSHTRIVLGNTLWFVWYHIWSLYDNSEVVTRVRRNWPKMSIMTWFAHIEVNFVFCRNTSTHRVSPCFFFTPSASLQLWWHWFHSRSALIVYFVFLLLLLYTTKSVPPFCIHSLPILTATFYIKNKESHFTEQSAKSIWKRYRYKDMQTIVERSFLIKQWDDLY